MRKENPIKSRAPATFTDLFLFSLLPLWHSDAQRYLEEKPFQRSMKVNKMQNGQLLVTMKALNDELLFRWVLGYADSAEVIKPISLRNRLREFSYFLESTYRKSPW